MPPKAKRSPDPASPAGSSESAVDLGSPPASTPTAGGTALGLDPLSGTLAPGAAAPPPWAQQLLDGFGQLSSRLDTLEGAAQPIPALPTGTYLPPAGAPSAPAAAGTDASSSAGGIGAEDDVEYVPDVGRENPHARAVHAGGDTYLRPQRYNMHRNTTFDSLKSKPKGTLFEVYTTLEPSLRYLFNVVDYIDRLGAAGESIDADEMPIHLERIRNSVSGVYTLVNKYVGLIHLRATYGDNPTEREKLKLEHVREAMAQADFLPASLDDRIRELCDEFDSAYDSQRRHALAKKAAGSGGSINGRVRSCGDG